MGRIAQLVIGPAGSGKVAITHPSACRTSCVPFEFTPLLRQLTATRSVSDARSLEGGFILSIWILPLKMKSTGVSVLIPLFDQSDGTHRIQLSFFRYQGHGHAPRSDGTNGTWPEWWIVVLYGVAFL